MNTLGLGADDYLVKPFSMRELVARVSAAARRGVRSQPTERGQEIQVEELRIDPVSVQAYLDGRSAGLTPTEFRLLYALAEQSPRVRRGTSCSSRSGVVASPGETGPSTCSSASCARRSTRTHRATRSSTRATASATSSNRSRNRVGLRADARTSGHLRHRGRGVRAGVAPAILGVGEEEGALTNWQALVLGIVQGATELLRSARPGT